MLGPETSAQDKEAFTARFGVPLVEGYGSSENAIVLKPVGGARPGSLGRADPADDVAVVDPTSGEECPPADFDQHGRLTNPAECIGELVGRRARSNFEGYYNNPEADAERTRNGWYWSGDLAYRDGTGSSTSPGGPATGCEWTARISPPRRWSGSWPGWRG